MTKPMTVLRTPEDVDQHARTVEVTLPREYSRAGRFTVTLRHLQDSHTVAIIKSQKSTQALTVIADELEPLALALLAIHYKGNA